jgi:hypothetical protein
MYSHRAAAAYTTWEQVAGYFDGDGSVLVYVRTYTIYFTVEWTDTSLPQLDQIKGFLRRNAVYTSPRINVQKGKYTSYSLQVSFQDSILRLAKCLWKYSFKKRNELRAVINYLENKITANQAIEVFNQAVTEGTRAGIIRKVTIPYIRREGLRMARVEAGRKAGIARSTLSPEQIAEVKHKRADLHKTIRELAAEYHVSTNVILRALRTT